MTYNPFLTNSSNIKARLTGQVLDWYNVRVKQITSHTYGTKLHNQSNIFDSCINLSHPYLISLCHVIQRSYTVRFIKDKIQHIKILEGVLFFSSNITYHAIFSEVSFTLKNYVLNMLVQQKQRGPQGKNIGKKIPRSQSSV